jgi:hypothetical protein
MTRHQDKVYGLGFEGGTLLITSTGQIIGTLAVGGLQLDLDADPPHSEGLIHWNADDGTPEVGLPGGTVRLQMGQESVIRVKNVSGGELPNGTLVYVKSASGARPEVDKADPAAFETMGVLGMTTEAIASNQIGYVTSFGLVRDVDTDGTSEGDYLWLHTTAGEFSTTRPTAPNFQVFVGVVLRVHATEGVIFMRVVFVPRLAFLSDVYAPVLTNGDYLRWNTANARWEVSAT